MQNVSVFIYALFGDISILEIPVGGIFFLLTFCMSGPLQGEAPAPGGGGAADGTAGGEAAGAGRAHAVPVLAEHRMAAAHLGNSRVKEGEGVKVFTIVLVQIGQQMSSFSISSMLKREMNLYLRS